MFYLIISFCVIFYGFICYISIKYCGQVGLNGIHELLEDKFDSMYTCDELELMREIDEL